LVAEEAMLPPDEDRAQRPTNKTSLTRTTSWNTPDDIMDSIIDFFTACRTALIDDSSIIACSLEGKNTLYYVSPPGQGRVWFWDCQTASPVSFVVWWCRTVLEMIDSSIVHCCSWT
jgi:hypothetical protein